MAQRPCPYNFFAFTSRRAAGDRRLQARRAARAPQPACQGCARYCAVGALDILRGCAARRSWPEGLIADLSLMITSALNGKTCRRLQRTAPARGGRAARLQTASQECKPPAKKKVPSRGTGLCAPGRTHQINLEFGDPRLGL